MYWCSTRVGCHPGVMQCLRPLVYGSYLAWFLGLYVVTKKEALDLIWGVGC